MKKILETLKRKWTEYLIEIIVIMLGILSAYTLNNWNEARKDAAAELAALIDLKQEFSKKAVVFNEHYQFKQGTLKTWMDFISNISDQSLNDSERLITPLRIGVRTYNPSRSTLNSILSTGKIDKVENDSLKYFLTSWNDMLLDYIQDEDRHLDFWDKEYLVLQRSMMPYRFYNVDSLDTKKNSFYTEIETRKMNLDAYDNLEYQNLLLRNLYFLEENVKTAALILKTYNSIVELIEAEIKSKK
jgi:uncharacterized protein DUF6090